ncbi:hypothetical protein [Streptomyces wuyuanensis]
MPRALGIQDALDEIAKETGVCTICTPMGGLGSAPTACVGRMLILLRA